MTFRYIGSKSRIVHQIARFIGQGQTGGGTFVDAFCGTGAVAEAAAALGWQVRLNDHLHSAVIAAAARLASHESVPFKQLDGYRSAVALLNRAPPVNGFVWRTYSPASALASGFERRYFTELNAARIDGMRSRIQEWRDEHVITPLEEQLLIADLFSALNRVANIAGTFGCFLAKWTPQASETLQVRERQLKPETARVSASVGDVFDVVNEPNDVVYLDPPYTKRQYASYYHILETVALNDTPTVEGVAGLRPWKALASDFCYKTRALRTLSRLIRTLRARRVLLSYSSEGHIPMDEMTAELARIGKFDVHALGPVGRYRPNKVASSCASDVHEYLVVIDTSSASDDIRDDLKSCA